MKAICIHEYGGADNLRYEEVPTPDIGARQALVRVRAASINPIDVKLAAGMRRPVLNNQAVPLPWTPGCDFSGTVIRTPDASGGFETGDDVYGSAPSGGAFSQFVVASYAAMALKPRSLTYEEAASVPLAAQTAWQAIFDHGGLQSGQKILIQGGSGGVGSYAIQLAHWKRAVVFATGSSFHREYLLS